MGKPGAPLLAVSPTPIAEKGVLSYNCRMQILTDAREVEGTARMYRPDADAVDAVLTASRSLIAIATRSLGAAAEETTIAQYRALVVLASRGPQRIVSGRRPRHCGRFADAAGEVPDSQWPSPGPAEEAARPRMHDHLIRAAWGDR